MAPLLGAATAHLLLATTGLSPAPATLLFATASLLALATSVLLVATTRLFKPAAILVHSMILREGGGRGRQGDASGQSSEHGAAVRKAFHGRDLV